MNKILIFMAILIITTLLFNILVIKADSLIDLVYLRIALKKKKKKGEEIFNLLTYRLRQEREKERKSPYRQEPYILPYTEDYQGGDI